MEDHTDLIESLIVKVEDYGKTNIELTKLQVAKGASGVLSSLIAGAAVAITGAMFLVVFTVGIAICLGRMLGEIYYGFFIVAGFYALAALIFYLYLHKWVRKPISELVNEQAFNMPALSDEAIADSIGKLETEQEVQKEILKRHLHLTFESLKPINVVKNAIHSIADSPEIKKDLITTATSVAAGYVAKNVVSRNSRNPIRNMIGTFLEVGVTNMISKNPEKVGTAIKFVQVLFKNLSKPVNKEQGEAKETQG